MDAFHQWYRAAIEGHFRVDLAEHRDYDRILKGIGWRSSYALLLQVARSTNQNPFDRLGEYLHPHELEAVLGINDRRAQVDKIIEILDVYNACDEALRRVAYELFGVDPGDGSAT